MAFKNGGTFSVLILKHKLHAHGVCDGQTSTKEARPLEGWRWFRFKSLDNKKTDGYFRFEQAC
jgi:hypothetical protein